jgi:hypothetical protein
VKIAAKRLISPLLVSAVFLGCAAISKKPSQRETVNPSKPLSEGRKLAEALRVSFESNPDLLKRYQGYYEAYAHGPKPQPPEREFGNTAYAAMLGAILALGTNDRSLLDLSIQLLKASPTPPSPIKDNRSSPGWGSALWLSDFLEMYALTRLLTSSERSKD